MDSDLEREVVELRHSVNTLTWIVERLIKKEDISDRELQTLQNRAIKYHIWRSKRFDREVITASKICNKAAELCGEPDPFPHIRKEYGNYGEDPEDKYSEWLGSVASCRGYEKKIKDSIEFLKDRVSIDDVIRMWKEVEDKKENE
jgi:hypothetical protein